MFGSCWRQRSSASSRLDGAVLAGPLIAAAELAELLGSDDQPVVLDIRWDPVEGPGRDGYVKGHIPGAVFIDLDEQLAGPPSERGRHPLPSAERFEAAMRAAGVSRARPVVVCDQGGSMWAARAWWMLRYFGHEDVAVLDGGTLLWKVGGYPLEVGAGAAVNKPGDFVAQPGGMPVVSVSEVEAIAADGVLIDARHESQLALITREFLRRM